MPKVTNFTKRVGAMTVARSISLAGALLVMMVLTRLLDEHQYGQYQKLWLIFTLLCPALINTAVQTLYYRGGSEKSGNPFWVAFTFVVFSGIAVASATFLFAGYVSDFINAPELSVALRYFSIYMLFATIAGIGEPLFILIERKKWLLGYNLVYNLFDAGLVIVPFLLGYTLEQVVLFMLAGPAIRSLFLLLLLLSQAPKIQRATWHEELSISAKYASGIITLSLLGLLIFEADKLVVAIFMPSDADFATYVVGAKKIPFLTALIASVSSAFIVQYAQKLSSKDRAEVIPAIRHTANRLFVLILPATLFGLYYAEEILVVLFEKYAHSAPIFRIYLLAMITNIFISDTVILGAGESRVTARFSALELLINIIFSILLIIPLGLIGPAIATVMGRCVHVAACNWYCNKHYQIPWQVFFPVSGWQNIGIAWLGISLSFVMFDVILDLVWIGFIVTGSFTLGITIWQNKHVGRMQHA